MTERQALELKVTDRVAEIRLCRPELLNRFDSILNREMIAALDEVAGREDVLAIVLCSTGRFFSAGGDTEVMLEAAGNITHRMAMIDEGRRMFRSVADCPKPLVVALAGNSYGLGSSLILAALPYNCWSGLATRSSSIANRHAAARCMSILATSARRSRLCAASSRFSSMPR